MTTQTFYVAARNDGTTNQQSVAGVNLETLIGEPVVIPSGDEDLYAVAVEWYVAARWAGPIWLLPELGLRIFEVEADETQRRSGPFGTILLTGGTWTGEVDQELAADFAAACRTQSVAGWTMSGNGGKFLSAGEAAWSQVTA